MGGNRRIENRGEVPRFRFAAGRQPIQSMLDDCSRGSYPDCGQGVAGCGVDHFVLYGTELLRQLVLVVQVVHQRQRGLAGLVGLPVLLGTRPPLP